MKTVVFYSYKGGTGRTLVLANVARYLQQFNQRVFMVDFDLEAPGLHHKLQLAGVDHGVVDYLLHVQEHGRAPDTLSPYVVPLPGMEPSDGRTHVMAAGRAPSRDYARRLGQLDWHRLFYGESPIGVPAFLELKAQIEAQYEPDFLLIDARTGITEIGGVATTILADTVVCLTLNNRENLAGTRLVLRAVLDGARDAPVQVVPALSRVPETIDRAEELLLTSSVMQYLRSGDARDDEGSDLELDEILVLHTEPTLQLQERILVGEAAARDSILLRDYLALFSRTVPQDVLLPHIENLVSQVQESMLDDPVGAQRDLEALAGTTGHPIAWRSLIKFYGLRNMHEELLPAAMALWHLKTGEDDELLWSVVQGIVSRRPGYVAGATAFANREAVDFLIDVWSHVGPEDSAVARHLIETLRRAPDERFAETVDIARTHLEATRTAGAVALLANELLRHNQAQEALRLTSTYAREFGEDLTFLKAWAQSAIACGRDEAARLLNNNSFSAAILAAQEKVLAARLYAKAGKRAEATDLAQESLVTALRRDPTAYDLYETRDLYEQLDAAHEFRRLVEQHLGQDAARDLLSELNDLYRSHRPTRRYRSAARL